MSGKMLSQEEIDALFNRYEEKPIHEEAKELLTLQELDTIGEVGNICMGTAATTLSELLNHRITIGYPKTIVCNQEEVFKSFLTPYLTIKVQFEKGLSGFNVLIISAKEVAIIADIMMGGTGEVSKPIEIGEMELSATTEAMNQMIGASATAMSELFGVTIDIAPPESNMVADLINANHTPLPTDQPVVVSRFEITIGELIKTTFMQITNVDAAREQANFLLMQEEAFEDSVAETGGDVLIKQQQTVDLPEYSSTNWSLSNLPNLTGALGVPLELVFSLGKTICTAGDLAKLQVGDEIALPSDAKQVEILIGGVSVIRGGLQATGETAHVKIEQFYQSGFTVKKDK